LDYKDYLAENLDINVEYVEYVAENLQKSIDYSEYIAENLDKSINYSEYLADAIVDKREVKRKEREKKLKRIFHEQKNDEIKDLFSDI